MSTTIYEVRLYVRMEVLRKLKLVREVQIWYVETYKIVYITSLKKKC